MKPLNYEELSLNLNDTYDTIVVGGGHAGIEASLATAAQVREIANQIMEQIKIKGSHGRPRDNHTK